jgi:hypothetical protein
MRFARFASDVGELNRAAIRNFLKPIADGGCHLLSFA